MVIFYAILDNFTPFFHLGKHSFSGTCHIYLIGNTQVLGRHWHIGWCLLVFMVIYDIHDFMCSTCPKTLNLSNVVEKKAYPLLLDCDLWGSFVIARVYHWKKMKLCYEHIYLIWSLLIHKLLTDSKSTLFHYH